VFSYITAKKKTTADGISRQAEQAIRKEVERLSSKLRRGITDSIRAELLDLIKEALPKERKELDYEKLTEAVTKILDERRETESRATLTEGVIPVDGKAVKSDNKITRGLLVASLLLNILLLALFLYKMIFESWIPFF
jgi:hypothetical protein